MPAERIDDADVLKIKPGPHRRTTRLVDMIQAHVGRLHLRFRLVEFESPLDPGYDTIYSAPLGIDPDLFIFLSHPRAHAPVHQPVHRNCLRHIVLCDEPQFRQHSECAPRLEPIGVDSRRRQRPLRRRGAHPATCVVRRRPSPPTGACSSPTRRPSSDDTLVSAGIQQPDESAVGDDVDDGAVIVWARRADGSPLSNRPDPDPDSDEL
jgi:hypothetical protein